METPPPVSTVGETEFITPDDGLLGSPGMSVLQFKVVTPGQTVLHLDDKHAQATETGPEKTLEVTVVIK